MMKVEQGMYIRWSYDYGYGEKGSYISKVIETIDETIVTSDGDLCLNETISKHGYKFCDCISIGDKIRFTRGRSIEYIVTYVDDRKIVMQGVMRSEHPRLLVLKYYRNEKTYKLHIDGYNVELGGKYDVQSYSLIDNDKWNTLVK